LHAGEDEKELVFECIFFYPDREFPFLFPVIKKLTTLAAAAIVAEHAKANSTSSALLKASAFIFKIKSIT
jgi:hypothetical protein